MEDILSLQSTIGITFSNPDILEQALVHRSYLNENPSFRLGSNERLEFLGDSVLGLVAAEELYVRFPSFSEGQLTKLRAALVREETLSALARSVGLGQYLYLGNGEERSGGRDRPSILAAALEAVIGAVFLDKGFSECRDFTLRLMVKDIAGMLDQASVEDPKSRLQELSQERWQVAPTYRTISESGPDHAKEFTVEVLVGETALGQGSARTKQAAAKKAARVALQHLDKAEA
ncbi:MAG: ribonuclease III [Chloroflexi bacterium]|nr:ribonuclease III [Chloroflexota bacterium]